MNPDPEAQQSRAQGCLAALRSEHVEQALGWEVGSKVDPASTLLDYYPSLGAAKVLLKRFGDGSGAITRFLDSVSVPEDLRPLLMASVTAGEVSAQPLGNVEVRSDRPGREAGDADVLTARELALSRLRRPLGTVTLFEGDSSPDRVWMAFHRGDPASFGVSDATLVKMFTVWGMAKIFGGWTNIWRNDPALAPGVLRLFSRAKELGLPVVASLASTAVSVEPSKEAACALVRLCSAFAYEPSEVILGGKKLTQWMGLPEQTSFYSAVGGRPRCVQC